MGKRLETLLKIQTVLNGVAQLIKQMFYVVKDMPVTKFKKEVIAYLLLFSKANANFSLYILSKVPESYKKDKMDRQFNDIIKQLKGKK